jgi:hypothetical protein
MTVAGGASAAMRRHFANNRSKLEKLPTWFCHADGRRRLFSW